MSNIAIRVDNLSKLYRIGTLRHDTLRDTLSSWFRWGKDGRPETGDRPPSPVSRPHSDLLWALKDVSFDVKHGEVVGIIGRNGAGKSTLLKILSRITKPTTGSVEIHGRVGSLLEVGTGFHPELTGRENIYLNGAILGMKRSEIDRKFDEIVAFAEIEKFLDTPVKRYSSGMYVRLAFAVAAHLEPEILIVDEVLAVGDAAFQKKCLGKMGDVAKEGRTVLFVSHNLAAVAGLCKRAIALDNGSVFQDSIPSVTIQAYLQRYAALSGRMIEETVHREGAGPIRFTSFHCESKHGEKISHLNSGQFVRLVFGYKRAGNKACSRASVAAAIYDSSGYKVTNVSSYYFHDAGFEELSEVGEFICELEKLPLRGGHYTLELYCEANGQISDWIKDVKGFEVSDGDYYGTGRITNPSQGVVFVNHKWYHQQTARANPKAEQCVERE